MHVAMHWRNKKLRYRMIRAIEHQSSDRETAKAKTLGFPRAIEKRERRVRAVS